MPLLSFEIVKNRELFYAKLSDNLEMSLKNK